MEETVNEPKSELKSVREGQQSLQLLYSEAVATLNENERQLETPRDENHRLKEKEENTQKRVEHLGTYWCRFTMVLAGRAIPDPSRGEDIRDIVLWLLRVFLGITLDKFALKACHRLENGRSVVVRFRDPSDHQNVYHQRTRLVRNSNLGLLVFENLSEDRMAVVNILRDMRKDARQCPFKNFYTYMGIYIKVREGA